MRRTNYVLTFWTATGLAIALAGCGSSSSSSSNNTNGPLTGLSKRVLVSNQTTSNVIIVDAKRDAFSTKSMGATGAAKMVTANGFTVVQSTRAATITMINNSQEAVSATGSLLDVPTDVAISTNGTTAWAAVRNKSAVEAFDTTTGNIKANVTAALLGSASRLVMSPNGTKLLVFSDDTPTSFTVIDTATFNPVALTATGLDHPYTGVFNGSENKAFILSCGGECGGAANGAGVMEVDFSSVSFNPVPASQPVTLTPVAGPTAPGAITGATVGLLSGSTLFVAGTPAGSSTGTLQTVDAGSLAVTNDGSIPNGLHQVMAMTSNNRLYVGASDCTVTPVPPAGSNLVFGCLAVFDTSAHTITIPPESSLRQDFNVTGLQPISNRGVIYVVQGGELDFFDITTNLPSTSITQLDIFGNAIGIVQIDP
jgi:hypothetical protein